MSGSLWWDEVTSVPLTDTLGHELISDSRLRRVGYAKWAAPGGRNARLVPSSVTVLGVIVTEAQEECSNGILSDPLVRGNGLGVGTHGHHR